MRSLILLLSFLFTAAAAHSQNSFSETVEGWNHKPGFFDIYVDDANGQIYAALPAPRSGGISQRFIYATGLTAGLGSNPIGLDRGAANSGVIVRFRKIGNKIIAEQENWRFRASADRPREKLAVAQSFATSFLWSTEIVKTAEDGRILINLSDFLIRDQLDIANDLKHGEGAGAYRLAKARSMPDPSSALVFPDNVELDAFLTFETGQTNAQTRATAPDARAVTLIQHHSFVRLPPPGYTPRAFDQRTANIGMGFYDYSSPLDAAIVQRLSRRFRLEKRDPSAAISPARKPIVFYVDAGAPKQIRDALIEGASWWAEGFEAAGFKDAYRVEVLPETAHPLDVRYNVINWVHRQTRGWSYGGSISDPRTGEILKANVILGSQRVRQDRMIFEGLAGVSETGTGSANDPVEISLARIRQLAAHEVGHTLGFAHNFAASANDRASVMDYPAPYIRPIGTSGLDFSNAYATGLGAWDVFTVKWLYSDFAESVDETATLDAMVDQAEAMGLRFIADRHGRSVGTAHPYASVWDNGTDAIETLNETMQVRAIALQNFGPDRLAIGRPSSDLNAVIVPIYLYHRYQIAAAAKFIGGLDYTYSVNGDNRAAAQPVNVVDQRRALSALLATIDPAVLDLSDAVMNRLTPGDVGYAGGGQSLELFPNATGAVFDVHAAADIAANLTFSALLHSARLERLSAIEMRGGEVLTLSDLLNETVDMAFAEPAAPRLLTLSWVVQKRLVQSLISAHGQSSNSPAVTAKLHQTLLGLKNRLGRRRASRNAETRAHYRALVADIAQHLEAGKATVRAAPKTPPGSPIGSGQIAETCWHCDPV